MSDANFLIFIFLVFIFGCLVGHTYGVWSMDKDWRNDAVKNGHGEWVADKDGKAVWRWKEIPHD